MARSALPVRAVVLDFDGAVSPTDVTEALLRTFGEPSWWDIERDMRVGTLGLREALIRQAGLLRGGLDEWLEFAVSSFALEPTFEPFVRWARSEGLVVAVASDGLGFYIEPMLSVAGIDGIRVHSNAFDPVTGTLGFPEANGVCVGCGTCKMNVVLGYRDRTGPTAFVGEGFSDRYGALYADITFAKHHLAAICARDGIAFTAWETFDDVRSGLERMGPDGLPGPPSPERCPGWTDPPTG
jgi:2-hydroxy-3-keto-5-methylthiopentenyl-1-phosphate phosphatase